jgi:hypothetical protein
MNIGADSLQKEGKYKLLYALEHEELIVFVRQQLKNANLITLCYWFANVGIVGYAAWSIYSAIKKAVIEPGEIFAGLGLGFFLALFAVFIIHDFMWFWAF